MNRVLLFSLSLLLFVIVSCKEKNTIINTSGTKAVDTTYMADVEQQQARVVLVEEFTGVSCPQCVKGHVIIYGPDGLKHKYTDQVAVIAYHIINNPLTSRISGHSRTDFRTQDATNVGNTIYGSIPGLPSAGIDRAKNTTNYLFDRDEWIARAGKDITNKNPVNLYITSRYNAATRNAIVTIKVAYTQKTTTKQSITLALVENNIIDAQENGITNTIDDNYTHNSVLRTIITQFYGDPIIDNIAIKEPGRVYERTFNFNVNPAWNQDNCQLVAFIHNNAGDNKDVLQAAEVNLK